MWLKEERGPNPYYKIGIKPSNKKDYNIYTRLRDK